MTGSLRLSALLLLLLSRWASADLEKGEDEFVRSWVIIEEQLVPPSRDELLATGAGGGAGTVGTAAVGAAAGRRITPKSVFVAPSFNKCSDGYRPDTMGRCVKVVKLNQAAQWDFLLKQFNSMYGAGAGFPVHAASAAYRPVPTPPTTTAEPSSQKTDSPGPFQLNIPLAGVDSSSSGNQTMETVDDNDDDDETAITTTPAVPSVNPDPGTVIAATASTASTTYSAAVATAVADDGDAVADPTGTAQPAATDVPVTTGRPSRPYRNRYQTFMADDEAAVTATSAYDTTTDTKTKYVDGSRTMAAEDSPKTTTAVRLGPATATVAGVTETEEPETDAAATASSTEADDLDDVVTVLAVPALMDPHSTLPPVGVAFTTVGGGRTHGLAAADSVTPAYYDDQPEELTAAPEPDCTVPNAHRYFAECAGYRQQQQQQQYQQQQLLLQQHQQQQQLYQQQQQQQFYHQQLQQQQQFQQQQPHVATALVKRPVGGGSPGGVQVRFPEEDAGDPGSAPVAPADNVNLIRFPGPAPYRTTNKMYESSRHPTWWPTGWPEQQQQQQQSDSAVQHRLQHHLPQQKQDVRLWEFGSRLPKTTTTTTAVPPPPPAQWFHRFF